MTWYFAYPVKHVRCSFAIGSGAQDASQVAVKRRRRRQVRLSGATAKGALRP